MKIIGNIIWFVFGGIAMGLLWWLAGAIMYITIIGIPWGKACFTIGTFTFFPFGKEAISREVLTGKNDIGTGTLGMIGNALWFVFFGFWLAIGHVGSAVLCFITIIGIPFGVQHFKLAGISLFPVGKAVVPKEVAEEARKESAKRTVKDYRR